MRDMHRGDGRLGLGNVLLALILGGVIAAAMFFCGRVGLDPSLWEEVNVASGVYPPRSIFPGYWRLVTGWLFALLGVESAVQVLSVAGMVAAGGIVALFYLVVRQVEALLIRTGRTYPAWYGRIAPFSAAVAALCFGMGDPLRWLARTLSPDELELLALLAIVQLSLRWFTVGGNWRLFGAWALMGLMAAETPFAVVLPIAFVIAFSMVWHCVLDGLYEKLELLPEPEEMPKWRMFFLFLGGLAVGCWCNATTFIASGGLEANAWQSTDIYFRYGTAYWRSFLDASSLVGWMLGLCFALLPMIAALKIFPMVARDDQAMPFNFGVIVFLVGAIGVMQCGAFPSARFWVFVKGVTLVKSGFLLAFFHASAMLALALAIAAFAFECQRTYLTEESLPPGRALKSVVPVAALVFLAMAAWHFPKPVEAEVQAIVDDAVSEIVRESGAAKWIFTDGRLDAAIERQAVAEGKALRPLNLMSGASEWEIALRRRHFADASADREAAETGIPMLFRVWAAEKPHGLDEAAIQLGFEMWKRTRKPMPRLSGMVARVTGMSEAEAAAGIERTKALASRILAVAERLDEAGVSPALASAFSAVNWRISRFARFREDNDLADQLDLSNDALKRMLSLVEYERMRTFMQLTPREGLEIALRRADFVEARRYASMVLRFDEENPEANFGMGMSALALNNLKEAEHYLKQCLIKRPDEPAALNNLSIICRKQRRYEEAEKYARRAAELLPTSTEVQKTLQDALKKAP